MRPLGARAVGHELVRQAGAAEESSGGGSDGRVTLVVACRRRPSSWPARATEGVICGAVDGRASDWGKANHAQICGVVEVGFAFTYFFGADREAVGGWFF